MSGTLELVYDQFDVSKLHTLSFAGSEFRDRPGHVLGPGRLRHFPGFLATPLQLASSIHTRSTSSLLSSDQQTRV